MLYFLHRSQQQSKDSVLRDKLPLDVIQSPNIYEFKTKITHSRRDLFRVFDIGQIEGILGIILAKEFF